MPKRFFALLVVLFLMASACSQAKEESPGGTTGEKPQTEVNKFTVNVDGKTDKFNLATLSFFPR